VIEPHQRTKSPQRRAADAFDVEQVLDLAEATLLSPLVEDRHATLFSHAREATEIIDRGFVEVDGIVFARGAGMMHGDRDWGRGIDERDRWLSER
jgi:hypothetical protein